MLGLMERLNEKIRYYLAEFGERICTTIFAAYLNYLETDAGEEWKSQAVNIGGRGGSDLTATTIAKELGSTEIQFWEDVDGVMTCDPTVCGNAMPQPCLTFEEAAEIMIFGTQTMQLATEGGITIKVKNMYRPEAPGTVISNTRDMNKDMLTSIVLKPNIIILNIKSKRVAAQSKFEARELGTVLKKLTEFADVDIQHKSIICVVGNAQDSPRILAKDDEQVMNISFVVKDNEAKRCVQTIHSVFFEDPAKFFHSINDEDIDPVRSAIDDVGYLDCVMDAGAPAAQPEQPFGVGIHSDDFGTEVPDFNMGVVFDVGEGCSGAPNILDENELSYHRVKETKDGALNTIEPMMLSDNLFLMPDTGQRFGESDPPATACQQFTGNPAAGNFAENPGVGGGSGFGCSPATAYACPAAYQTFAGARDGDDYPMLNEDAYTLHDNFNMEDFDVGSPPIRFDLITEATGV